MSILISLGPVPAKLDSVKYLNNRFKGGLGYKTAKLLRRSGHTVTIMKWKHLSLNTDDFNTITFDDILEYREKILAFEADAYILSAAVANLMPVNPWPKKFPSHKYKVGEEFNIKFCIAPRIIDEIKNKFPRSSLIGYKLLDGNKEDLLQAARKTLYGSKSNIVFANTPFQAKTNKYMLTQDGAVIDVSFYNHVLYISKLINSNFYKTNIINDCPTLMNNDIVKINTIYPRTTEHGRTYGCFMIRTKNGFVTTARGKLNNELVFVNKVTSFTSTVEANAKATLNTPLLYSLLKTWPDFNIVLHNHKQIPNVPTLRYEFPGTQQEARLGTELNLPPVFNIEHHGYIARFKNLDECVKWVNDNDRLEKL